MNNNVKRKSGIELLRIISMFMICLSHSVNALSTYIGQSNSDISLGIILKIISCFGTIGNLLFILCSFYFLVDSRKAKTSKFVGILLDTQFISICITAAFCVLCSMVGAKINYNSYFVLSSIFPDLYAMQWFVTAYLIIYIFHPYLNMVASAMSKKFLLAVCLTFILIYSIGGLIGAGPQFSKLFGFFMIYFIVWYIKNYDFKWFENVKISAFVLFITIIILPVAIYFKEFLNNLGFSLAQYISFDEIRSIIFLPMTFSMFVLFVNMNFSNKIINYISSCTLFIYCIHENEMIRSSLRPKFYNIMCSIFGDSYYGIYVAILGLILFFGSLILAIIYKHTLHKLSQKVTVYMIKKCSLLLDNIGKII